MEEEKTTTPPVVEDKGGQEPPAVTPPVAKGGEEEKATPKPEVRVFSLKVEVVNNGVVIVRQAEGPGIKESTVDVYNDSELGTLRALADVKQYLALLPKFS